MSKQGSKMRAWALSKVVNMQNGTATIFDASSFTSLTGHAIDNNKDFIFVMNGDETSAGTNGAPGSFTTVNFNSDNGGAFIWGSNPSGTANNKTGVVRANILVVSIY